MKRLFLAIKIEPTDHFIDVYSSFKNELKHEKIKWVEPYNLHLTIKFFGKTREDLIETIISKISDGIVGVKKFSFEIEKIGIFGSKYQPKVIWAEIPDKKDIVSLENSISAEISKIGYTKDRQNFVPHLTLGRIRFLKDKDLFQAIIDDYSKEYFQKQLVSEICLFESVLKKEGPEYTIVESFRLT